MKRKGFTLIELLVVVAIIALLISILLPSLSRARELAKRAVCSANQRGIGQGMYIYANDNEEWFPHHFYSPTYTTNVVPLTHGIKWVGLMGTNSTISITEETGSDGQTSTSTDASHPSRSLFLMVVGSQSTPGQFICPSASGTEDDLRNRGSDAQTGNESAAQPGKDRFDFRGYSSLSFGYQLPFGNRGKPRTSLDSRMALMADKGPYYSSAGELVSGTGTDVDQLSGQDPPSDWESETLERVLKKSNDEWRNYNSRNHNGEGQNILFVDGHVDFKNKAGAGINNDNIYTIHSPNLSKQKFGVVGQVPKKNAKWGPSRNTDSFIVP